MPRRQYLISYDVSDDKRRDRMFSLLCGQGDHVQFSVFFCALNRRELVGLRGQLETIIHHTQDQVLILDLGEGESPLERALTCLGKPYEPSTRIVVV